jgi:hypothetical protein
MRANLKAITAKMETIYGTDATPQPADALVLDKDTKITPLEHDTVDNSLLRPAMGADASLQVGGYGEIELSLPFAGASALGTAPVFDSILRACGLSAAVSAGSCVTYGLISSGFESASCYAFEDGDVTKLSGCRGSVSFEIKAKAKPMIKAKLTGLSVGPIAGSLPAVNLSPANVKPIEFANSSMMFNGSPVIMESLTIDLGYDVSYTNLVNLESVDIVNRSVSAKLSIRRPKVSELDLFALRKNGAMNTLYFKQDLGATNYIELYGRNAQISGLSTGESDGHDTIDIDLRLVGGADDEFELNFGALKFDRV